MTHELKCWPAQFQAVVDCSKTFEFRRADRAFAVGDWLVLRELDPVTETYTNRSVRRLVTYVLSEGFGLREGYAILGLEDPRIGHLRQIAEMFRKEFGS